MVARRIAALAFVVFLSAGAAVAAGADKAAPVHERAAGPLRYLAAPGQRAFSICQIGEPDTSLDEINYIDPPNDSYYTFLAPTQCPSCGAPDSIVIKFAHVVLDYPVQCILNARVSVVGATGGPSCWAPDTNDVLCPPRDVSFEPTNSGVYDLAATLTSGCKIAKNAFLNITFMSFDPQCSVHEDHPRLILSSQCAPCMSYNEYGSSGGRTRIDMCPFLTGRPTMYVEGELCLTPAIPASWGKLKMLYR